MSGSVTPASPVAELEPYIVARLRPFSDYDPRAASAHSDFGPEASPPLAGRTPAPAAVLFGLIERESGLSLLLTRRSDALRRHSGQVALPGGRMEPGETPAEAALRESFEEVGLEPQFVRLAGLGDGYETGTGFAITPVVGFISPGFRISRHEAEVAEVFETPFAFLMDPANHELRVGQTPDGQERRYYAMAHEEHTIWGATAGMVRALQQRLFG